MSKRIRIVSHLPYLGNTVSGSIKGYYTIWQARINKHNQITGQPKPVHVNQNLHDLKAYRGKLYSIDYPEIIRVKVKNCKTCGKLALIPESRETCGFCHDRELYGGTK